MDAREAYATFNMGAGFALYVDAADAGRVVSLAQSLRRILGPQRAVWGALGLSAAVHGPSAFLLAEPENVVLDGVLEVRIPMPKREQQQKHKRLEIR